MIEIQNIKTNQAESASQLLCRSICELCTLDHKNDPNIIAQWISNKTPEHILEWMNSTETFIFIASVNGVLAGIGSCGSNGEIFLNFVSPDYRFQGISKKLLNELERKMEQLGIENAMLFSTATALAFYKQAGWVEFGTPDIEFGITGYPMTKKIPTRLSLD